MSSSKRPLEGLKLELIKGGPCASNLSSLHAADLQYDICNEEFVITQKNSGTYKHATSNFS